jgi:transcriptional regulator with XRE-family HTH domain
MALTLFTMAESPIPCKQRILKMNERIRELRKVLNLSGEKFGTRIGIKKSAVSKMESGETAITEQTIKLIVAEFGISEIWLRTGGGEMYGDKARAERLNAALNKEGNEFIREVIYKMTELSTEQAAAFRDFVIEVVADYETAAAVDEPKPPLDFPAEGNQPIRVEKNA